MDNTISASPVKNIPKVVFTLYADIRIKVTPIRNIVSLQFSFINKNLLDINFLISFLSFLNIFITLSNPPFLILKVDHSVESH